MAQFAIDEILTTGIAISGFVFDVSNNIGANGYVLTSTSSGVMWQQDSSNTDLSALSGQIAATGSLLNNRINSLSGYANNTFLSGVGVSNYVPRWSGTKLLVTGSIFDLGTGVGIGTTDPVALLTVGSTTTTSSEITLQGQYQSSVFNNANIFNFRHGGFNRWRLLTTQNSAASNDFDFSINAINATVNAYNAFLTIKGLNGNVGISTTNPTTLLSVGGAGSTTAASGLTFGGDAQANLYRSAEDTIKTDGSLVVAANATFAGNVGIGLTNPAVKLDVSGGNARFSDYIIIGEDLAYPTNTGSAYLGYAANSSAGPQSNLELIDALSNAIGVNDPLRFRGTISGQYFSGNNWYADPSPLSYGNLLNGNATSYLDIVTSSEYSVGISGKRFVVDQGTSYTRPTFILLNTEWNQNWWGFKLNIENSNDLLNWTGCISEQTFTTNNTRGTIALNFGNTLPGGGISRYFRFSFVANQAITAGSLRVNKIRSLGNQNYSSSIPVSTSVAGNLIASVGIISPTITSLSGNLAATGSVLDTKINALSGYSNSTFATITNLATTGSVLNAKINSLSGYVNNTFLSGSGIQNYIPRWNTAKELITGSIYDLGTGIGIGTTSPAAKLEVKGADDALITAIFQSFAGGNTAYNGGIQLGNAVANQNSQIYHSSAGDNTLTFVSNYAGGTANKFVFAPGGTETVRFQQNGRVGIGNAAPTTLLSVGGAGSTSATSGITFGADSQANLYRISSSRIKTDGNFTIDGQGGGATSLVLNRSSTSSENGMAFNTAGSTDWYFYVNDSSNNLQIQRSSEIDSAPRVRFDGANSNILFNLGGGNVGIGIDTPSGKLHVVSSIAGETVLRADGTNGTLFSVTDDLSDSLMSVNNSAGLPVFEVFADDRVIAGQYGSGDFVLKNNKVGIGLTNPGEKLDVNGNVRIGLTTTNTIGTSNVFSLQTQAINIQPNSSTDTLYIRGLSAGNYQLQTATASANGGNLHLQPYGGNVGIGTTSPVQKLDVSGSIYINNNASYLYGKTTGGAATRMLGINSVNDFYIGSVDQPVSNIRINNNGSDRVLIDSLGNVGIGTINPVSRLDVNGGISLSGYLFADRFSVYHRVWEPGGNPALYLGDISDPTNYYDNNTHIFRTRGGGSERMRISSAGNVGIGTFSPSVRLHIENSGAVSSIATVRLVGSTGNNAGSQIEFYKAQNPKASIGLASAVTGGFSDDLLLLSSNPNSIILAAGSSGLAVFKPDGKVGIGVVNPISLLSVGGSDSTVAGSGITFGQDAQANLYRSAEDTIKTDGSLTVAGLVYNNNSAYYASVSEATTSNWGQYTIILGNSNYSNQLIQVTVDGGNATWNGIFVANATNSYRPTELWGNVKLLEYSTYNCNVDDVVLNVMSNTAPNLYGGTSLVLKTNPSVNGGSGTGQANVITVTLTGPAAGSFGSFSNSWISPYTYITSTSANTKQIYSNEAGRVGVGTTSPVQKLQVEGVVGNPASGGTTQSGIFRISNTTDNAVLDFGIRGGGLGAWIQSTDETSLAANYPLLLNPNGNSVGIGITNPSGQLHLRNMGFTSQSAIPDSNIFPNATGVFGLVMDHNAYTNGQYRHRFVKVDRSSNLPLYLQQAGGVANQYINLVRFGTHSQSTNTFEVFGDSKINGATDITSNLLVSGNAGFGTTTPTYQLTVIGANQATANITDAGAKGGSILVGSSVNAVDQGGAVLFATKNDANLYTPQFAIKSLFQNGMGSGIGDLAFSSRLLTGDSALTEVLRIKNDGRVGIGTSIPSTPLHVFGTGPNIATFTRDLATDASFTIGADNNGTVLGTLGVHNIQIYTNATERMRIASNGNVGIGTNVTPLKLNVSGSIYMAAGSGSAISWANDISSQFLKYDSVTDGMVLSSWSHTTFLTQQTERVRIASNGRVGIGFQTPTELLDVSGRIRAIGEAFTLNAATLTDSQTSIALSRLGAVADQKYWEILSYNAAANGDFAIRTINDAYSVGIDGLRIVRGSSYNISSVLFPNGNIGVGTTNPASLINGNPIYFRPNPNAKILDIYSNTNEADINLISNNSGDGSGIGGIYFTRARGQTDAHLQVAAIKAVQGGTNGLLAGGKLYFYTKTNGGGTLETSPAMAIATDSNVGIGTTTPISSLELYKIPATSGTLQPMLTITSDYPSAITTNFGSSIVFKGRTAGNELQDNAQISAYNENNNDNGYALGFYTRPSVGGGLQQRLTILRNGNVGVGITAPVQKFQVDGTVGNPALGGTTQTGIVRISNTTDNATLDFGMRAAGAGAWIQSTDETDLSAYYPLLLNPNGGNVGVGTTSALTVLDVRYKNTSNAASQVAGMTLRTNQNGGLEWHLNQTSTSYVGWVAAARVNSYGGNWGQGYLEFITAGAGGNISSTMTLNSGYVGIGITNPITLLSIGGLGAASAASGITFGQDAQANLYRISASTIKTDGSLIINGNLNTNLATVSALNINAGTLGASPVNISITGFTYAVNNGNVSQINFVEKRFAIGGDWTTATTRIQKRVDVTDQAYIEFNPSGALYGMALGVAAGGSLEAMRILSNGSIGIGTISPSQRLDVIGTIRANGELISEGNNARISLFKNNGINHFDWSSGQSLYFSTQTSVTGGGRSTLLAVTSGGNVGIGTLTPNGKLHVVSPDSAYAFSVAGATKGVRFNINSAGTFIQGVDNTLAGSYQSLILGGSDLYFQTNGVTNAMYIDSSGDVGINNTSPSSKLHVVETTPTGTRIQLGTNTENASMNAGLTNDLLILNAPYGTNSATVANSGAKWGIKFVGSLEAGQINTIGKTSAIYAVSEDVLGYNRGTSLAFYTNQFNDIPYAERMRIFHNGNIGIGTTQPAYKLQIVDSGTPASPTVLQVAGLNDAGGDAKLIIAQSPASSDLQLLVAGTDVRADGFTANDQYILAGQQLNLFNRGNGSTYNTQIMIGRDGGYGNISFSTAPQSQTAVVRMYISSGGNVGIGTTNPVELLDLYGSASRIKFHRGGAYDMSFGMHDSTFSALSIKNASDASTVAYFQYDGSVGIGTTNPFGKLHIYGNEAHKYIFYTDTAGSSSTIFQRNNVTDSLALTLANTRGPNIGTNRGVSLNLDLGYSGGAATSGVFARGAKISAFASTTYTANAADQNAYLAFYTATGGSLTEKVRIQADGKVGIGISSPITLLSVGGAGSTSATSGITFGEDSTVNLYRLSASVLKTDAAFTAASLSSSSYVYAASYLQTAGGQIYAGAPYGTLTVYVGNIAQNAWESALYIGRGSYVGIGTVQPSGKLHVVSTVAGETVLRADGTNGTLFSVTDDLSDSLMSVNNSAGLPVLEVFADDRVVAGQYGSGDFVIRNNKVGIGTTNPSYKLDINGSLGINASTSDTNWPFVVSDNSSAGSRYGLNKAGSMGFNHADAYAQLQLVGTNGAYLDLTNSVGGDSNARLIYYTNNRLDLTYGFINKGTISLNSNGVGIGTTNPAWALDVSGTAVRSFASGAVEPGFIVDYASSNGYGGLFIHTNGARKWRIGNVGDTDATNPALFIWQEGVGARMYFRNNGYIGVGTTIVDNKLSVSVPSDSALGNSADGLRITDGTKFCALFRHGTGYNYAGLAGSGSMLYSYDRMAIIADTSNPISFHAGGGERARIESNGNVGIGTTNPSSKLHVYDNGGSFRTDLDATYHMGIFNEYVSTYVTRTKFGRYSNTSNLEIYYDIAGTEEARITRNLSTAVLKFNRSSTTDMIIDGVGNVGIGTNAPTNTLQVVGQIAIKGDQSADNAKIHIQASDNSNRYTIETDLDANTNNDLLIFRSNTADNMLVLKGNGNIGINTTNPADKIHISGGGISFTSSTGLAIPMLGVTATNVAYVGPYATSTDGNAPSTVLFNHGASVQQTWFYSSGSVAMVLNRQGRLHIGNLNNTPNCLLSVGPSSSTTAVSGMCFGNDAQANLYRSAEDTIKTDGNLVVAGTTSLNGHIYGQKTVALSTASWTTVLTVNMLSHNSCYVKIGAFGDWSNHSAIAFVSELFIQNGDNAYNTPGTIITAHDNTAGAAGDKVDIQIVDPAAAGTQNFLIQLKLISATSSTNSSLITYHVMGQQASVT